MVFNRQRASIHKSFLGMFGYKQIQYGANKIGFFFFKKSASKRRIEEDDSGNRNALTENRDDVIESQNELDDVGEGDGGTKSAKSASSSAKNKKQNMPMVSI